MSDRRYLFTFVLEFGGGTYLHQVNARDEVEAKDRWAQSLDAEEIAGMGQKIRDALVADVAQDQPTPIKGLKNVWCIHGIVSNRSYLVHYTKNADPNVADHDPDGSTESHGIRGHAEHERKARAAPRAVP